MRAVDGQPRASSAWRSSTHVLRRRPPGIVSGIGGGLRQRRVARAAMCSRSPALVFKRVGAFDSRRSRSSHQQVLRLVWNRDSHSFGVANQRKAATAFVTACIRHAPSGQRELSNMGLAELSTDRARGSGVSSRGAQPRGLKAVLDLRRVALAARCVVRRIALPSAGAMNLDHSVVMCDLS